jgi:23S rRNA G2069 N7-methylase RlmK/C1962 C5-methylase RlmI
MGFWTWASALPCVKWPPVPAKRDIQLIQQEATAPSIPILAGMPETRYLKCFIVHVF